MVSWGIATTCSVRLHSPVIPQLAIKDSTLVFWKLPFVWVSSMNNKTIPGMMLYIWRDQISPDGWSAGDYNRQLIVGTESPPSRPFTPHVSAALSGEAGLPCVQLQCKHTGTLSPAQRCPSDRTMKYLEGSSVKVKEAIKKRKRTWWGAFPLHSPLWSKLSNRFWIGYVL